MHLEVLVEEPSAQAALRNLLPSMLGAEHTFLIHAFQDKGDLLDSVESRFRGYKRWIPEDYRIIVLVDEDRQECERLKARLEGAAKNAGLATKTSSGSSRFQVVNRIAVEELEAWFFGDVPALCAAFPRIPATLGDKASFRVPDEIKGGTREALHRVMKRAGYFHVFLPKIEVARRISSHMKPERNRSHSFQVFYQGIQACLK